MFRSRHVIQIKCKAFIIFCMFQASQRKFDDHYLQTAFFFIVTLLQPLLNNKCKQNMLYFEFVWALPLTLW